MFPPPYKLLPELVVQFRSFTKYDCILNTPPPRIRTRSQESECSNDFFFYSEHCALGARARVCPIERRRISTLPSCDSRMAEPLVQWRPFVCKQSSDVLYVLIARLLDRSPCTMSTKNCRRSGPNHLYLCCLSRCGGASSPLFLQPGLISSYLLLPVSHPGFSTSQSSCF